MVEKKAEMSKKELIKSKVDNLPPLLIERFSRTHYTKKFPRKYLGIAIAYMLSSTQKECFTLCKELGYINDVTYATYIQVLNKIRYKYNLVNDEVLRSYVFDEEGNLFNIRKNVLQAINSGELKGTALLDAVKLVENIDSKLLGPVHRPRRKKSKFELPKSDLDRVKINTELKDEWGDL